MGPHAKQVLCLQFSTVQEAQIFVSTFEGCRAHMTSPSGAGAAAAVAAASAAAGTTPDPGAGRTKAMRRRLTIAGGNPLLDGHKPGSHLLDGIFFVGRKGQEWVFGH